MQSHDRTDFEEFATDWVIQDALMRELEILGEAGGRVSKRFASSHPEIPWRAIAGLRDVLIHQYEEVDLAKVWAIVEKDLPSLRQSIADLLPPLEQLERELAGEEEAPEPTRKDLMRTFKPHFNVRDATLRERMDKLLALEMQEKWSTSLDNYIL